MTSEPFMSRGQRRALEREQRRDAEKARRRLRTAGASSAALTIAGLLVGGAAPAAAAAADYTVDNGTDVPSAGTTTLREAITAANTAPGPQTIAFNLPANSVIQLLSQISINDSVTITGPGKDQLFINGGNNGNTDTPLFDRIFYMHNPDSLLDITISDLTMRNGNTTQQNGTDARGGAILDIGESLHLTNVHLADNKAGNDGGAVFVDPQSDGAVLTMLASDVTGNTQAVTNVEPSPTPPFDGGGVAVSSASSTAFATVTITGSTFEDNVANGGNGGGLSVSNIAGHVTIDGGSSFGTFGFGNKPSNGNTATGALGGGASIEGRPPQVLLNSRVAVSAAASPPTTLVVDLHDTLFAANAAASGAGLAVVRADTLNMTGDAFQGNHATGAGGGAFLNQVPSGTIGSTNFGDRPVESTPQDSNTSNSDGGGLAATGSTLTVNDGSSFVHNTSGSDGGGLSSVDGTLTMTATTLSGNTADRGGGVALRVTNNSNVNTADISDTLITDNSGFYGAGGMFVRHSALTLTGSSVSSNHARSGDGGAYYGGGLYATYSQVDITGSTISGNDATGGGGGISLWQTTGSLTQSTVADNQAGVGPNARVDAQGGGMVLGREGGFPRFSISRSAVKGNTAPGDGGGIAARGVQMPIDKSTISGNTSTSGEGGGLWLNQVYLGSQVVQSEPTSGPITETTISSNRATQDGGGIYATSTNLSLLNDTVSTNTSTNGKGGGIYADTRNVDLDLTTVVNNRASTAGDGIYDSSGGSIRNSVVANNDAVFDSGHTASEDLSSGTVVVEGQVFDAAYSLIENPNNVLIPASATDPSNIFGTDPALGPLADNGGPLTGSAVDTSLAAATQLPTFTHLPSSGSPVIDKGDPGYNPTLEQPPYRMPNHDQRGLLRPVGARVDMGAVEVQSVAPPAPLPPQPQPASPSPSPSPAPNNAMRYVALTTPTRVLDTRNGTGTAVGRRTGDVAFDLSAVLPADANGVVLNVTVTGSDHRGHVLGFAEGSPYPPTSNLNFVAGQTQANETIIKVPASRRVVLSVFGANAHLVADVVGYFVPGDLAGANRVTTRTPTRVYDSRTTPAARRTGEITVDLNGLVPAGTTSAVLNLTATDALGGGFVVAYPTGTVKPGTSNVNYSLGSTQANEAFVRLGTGANAGKATLFVDGAAASVIVDLVGTVDPGPGTATELGTPVRVLDTRIGTGGPTGRVRSGEPLDVTLPAEIPASATGVILNLTSVAGTGPGYVVVYPKNAAVPGTSSLPFTDGHAVANEVLTTIGTDKKLTLLVGGHPTYLVVDVMGYISP